MNIQTLPIPPAINIDYLVRRYKETSEFIYGLFIIDYSNVEDLEPANKAELISIFLKEVDSEDYIDLMDINIIRNTLCASVVDGYERFLELKYAMIEKTIQQHRRIFNGMFDHFKEWSEQESLQTSHRYYGHD
jgi:hypothetical protein